MLIGCPRDCTTPFVRVWPLNAIFSVGSKCYANFDPPLVSIYCGYRQLPSDVQVRQVSDKRTPDRDLPQPSPHHLRRAQPALVLLPRTIVWIALLPKVVRPTALASRFARIANLICLLWGDRLTCGKYLAELLTADRGGRRGFPIAVLREIEGLQAFHTHMHRSSDQAPNWIGSTRSLWDGSDGNSE